MNHFYTVFFAVLQLLAYAFITFFLMRLGKLKEGSIQTLVTVLLYVCQPCLAVYSFQKATLLVADGTVSLGDMIVKGVWALGLSLVLQLAFLGIAYFFLRNKQDVPENRIFVIASVLANSGFFGLPLLEAVLGKEHPEVVMYTAIFSLVMNALCWTVVSTIITRDKKYISAKKLLLNPNTVAGVLSILLLCVEVILPDALFDMVSLLGRFSTPLCMFILGMRLALIPFREIFGNLKAYAICAVKNFGFPLFAFAVLYFLPVEAPIKQSMFIICACPAASMVLSFAELLGKGERTAANVVLLSTMSCLITLPLVCLLLPFLA